jgi:hypothetical protein
MYYVLYCTLYDVLYCPLYCYVSRTVQNSNYNSTVLCTVFYAKNIKKSSNIGGKLVFRTLQNSKYNSTPYRKEPQNSVQYSTKKNIKESSNISDGNVKTN